MLPLITGVPETGIHVEVPAIVTALWREYPVAFVVQEIAIVSAARLTKRRGRSKIIARPLIPELVPLMVGAKLPTSV